MFCEPLDGTLYVSLSHNLENTNMFFILKKKTAGKNVIQLVWVLRFGKQRLDNDSQNLQLLMKNGQGWGERGCFRQKWIKSTCSGIIFAPSMKLLHAWCFSGSYTFS